VLYIYYMKRFIDTFREEYSLDTRITECIKIRKKYPGRIPIIVSTANKEIVIDKHKYLVPEDCSFSDFSAVLRKRIKCNLSEGLFYYVGELQTLPRMSDTIRSIYTKHKSADGYLIVCVEKESTFG